MTNISRGENYRHPIDHGQIVALLVFVHQSKKLQVMRSIIIPTDFSETSKNAAAFAAHLSADIPGSDLILYTAFDRMEVGSDGSPLDSDDEGRKKIMGLALEGLQDEISGITTAPISLVVEEDNDFTDSLARYVDRHRIPLIIMGITGASKLEQLLIGSNTLKLINQKTVPLMIVPPEAHFKGVKNIMLLCDFDEVEKSIPIADLKGILDLFPAELHVVNIDSEHYIEPSPEYKSQRDKLAKILEGFNPKFYFLHLFDFVDTINRFVEDKQIDIIITIPKQRPLLSKLFNASHTKKLAYHTHIPLIAIHSLV